MGVLWPGVLFLQETMVPASDACIPFLKIASTWHVCVVDATGLSGGTLVAWNPLVDSMKDFTTCAGILIEGHFLGFAKKDK